MVRAGSSLTASKLPLLRLFQIRLPMQTPDLASATMATGKPLAASTHKTHSEQNYASRGTSFSMPAALRLFMCDLETKRAVAFQLF